MVDLKIRSMNKTISTKLKRISRDVIWKVVRARDSVIQQGWIEISLYHGVLNRQCRGEDGIKDNTFHMSLNIKVL